MYNPVQTPKDEKFFILLAKLSTATIFDDALPPQKKTCLSPHKKIQVFYPIPIMDEETPHLLSFVNFVCLRTPTFFLLCFRFLYWITNEANTLKQPLPHGVKPPHPAPPVHTEGHKCLSEQATLKKMT